MAAPTITNGEEHFFPIIYSGNGQGQRVGKFLPFTDNGTIAKSCMFNDGDNPYLSRTNDAGDRDTFTISVWVKRCVLGAVQHIFDTYDGSSSNDGYIRFNADNTISTRIGTPSNHLYTTNRTFENTSKWYHIMLSVNTNDSTAADRVKLYVDGDRITSFSTQTNAGSADDTQFNYSSATFRIGSTTGGSYDLDGYLAEFNQVDGSALTPSTFGITDTSTMRWIPKTLTGITYGTNGFRLTFADSSAFGDDTSGNTNDFTATNLATTDQTTDSPTQNSNTFGSISSGVTLSQGNLTVNAGSTGGYIQAVGQPAFGVRSGKWYWEVKVTTLGAAVYGWKDDGATGGSQANDGGSSQSAGLSTGSAGSFSAGSWFIDLDYDNEVNYTTVSTNDVLMFAMDLDSGKGYCGKNGTWFNSANPANGTGAIGGCHRANGSNKFYPCVNRLDSASVGEFNFGQRSFTYTAPTGFSTLQQDNMPETDKGISGLTWVKDRDSTYWHSLSDSSRGPNKLLWSNDTSAENATSVANYTNSLHKFLKGGFQTGDYVAMNTSGNSYVAWNWVGNSGTTATNTNGSITSTVQANTTAGFSIIEATAAASGNFTIGHGLSAAPDFFWLKMTGTTGNWVTFHHSIATTSGEYLLLDTTGAMGTAPNAWGAALPTSSVIGLGAGSSVTGSQPFVIHAWHGVDGFSKFGKYVGNSNADGTFVYTGFKPSFVLIKSTSTQYWMIQDSARWKFNPTDKPLFPSSADAESGLGAQNIDLVSNGFKCRGTGATQNSSSHTYIYMAFAEHPFLGDGTSPVTAR